MPLATDGMKECPRCKINKPVKDFARNKAMKDGLYGYCKLCKNEMNKERYKTSKERVLSLKQAPCIDCGKSYPPIIMQFDHVPERGTKTFKIAGGHLTKSLKTLQKEIDKCDIVCPTCHAIRTMDRLGLLTEEDKDVISKF